ncbi:efflux pump antibiotic resistance [Fusarium agapanthi]|uniref:Efflux pump antibiotic resistance n=1 Tax=Fusarium agapanthi TaxID=1803897 RepID=A0A9P5B4J9_9HYPO|nr:efflux pump antibiotic resistance [Fusarium agapanthi]
MASLTDKDNPPKDGIKIIHAGLYRTGTASMASAYRILGYKAHHALNNEWHEPWGKLEQAAEATFPHLIHLPDYTHNSQRPPFTREEWQSLWGAYDVATDVASTFTLELIKAYPDAKVVIVQRKFEDWWPSFHSQMLVTIFEATWLQKFLTWHVLRFRAYHAMRKIFAGFFSVNEYTVEAITPDIARRTYENFYSMVRDAVPEDKRLEYSLGDGWEPLCEFLGKDIPDVEFPRVNDRKAFGENMERLMAKLMRDSMGVLGPYLVAVLVVLVVIVVVVVVVVFHAWQGCISKS